MKDLKRIHVNRNEIASNLKNGESDPVVTAKVFPEKKRGGGRRKTHAENHYGHAADMECPRCGHIAASVVSKWTEDRELRCGATVWIETEGGILVRHNHEEDKELP